MGTRGCYGYRIKGKDKVTYNHMDSYPSELGYSVLSYVHNTSTEKMLEVAKKIKLVKSNSKPTKKQIKECEKFANLGVGTGKIDEWYCLLRNAQGELGVFEDIPYMIDSHNFLADSLFYEWAYIVNLDTKKVEIYKGFNKNPKASGRYAMLKDGDAIDSEQYYGVALVEEIAIEAVQCTYPSELEKYIAEFEQKIDEKEKAEYEAMEKPLKMAHSPDHD